MADLACNMVYVYLAGAWSWLNRATAARDRLTFRECALPAGHAGEHMPSLVREVPPTYTGLERLRLAGPVPERDRRRAAYAALERERARRALDAWFRAVEADRSGASESDEVIRAMTSYSAFMIDDYVSRLQGDVCRTCGAETSCGGACDECASAHRASALHHKGNYGVRPGPDASQEAHYDAEADADDARRRASRYVDPEGGSNNVAPQQWWDAKVAYAIVDAGTGSPLCTCPAMEQPHVRNQFTDCNAYDRPDVRGGGPNGDVWCTDMTHVGCEHDLHPAGLCDDPKCCTPAMSKDRKL